MNAAHGVDTSPYTVIRSFVVQPGETKDVGDVKVRK
jgi:hypothetical protein